MAKSLFSSPQEKVKEFKNEGDFDKNDNGDDNKISKSGKINYLKSSIKRALTFNFSPSVSKLKLQSPSPINNGKSSNSKILFSPSIMF